MLSKVVSESASGPRSKWPAGPLGSDHLSWEAVCRIGKQQWSARWSRNVLACPEVSGKPAPLGLTTYLGEHCVELKNTNGQNKVVLEGAREPKIRRAYGPVAC